jgi:hypothetical protein
MKNKLMISVAAFALIAGGGLASAQNTREAPNAASPSATPSGPSGGNHMNSGPAHRGGSEMKGTTGQAPAGANEKATDQGATTPHVNGRDNRRGENERHNRGTTGQNTGEHRGGADMKNSTDTRSNATTGQGAAGARGAVNLSTEQRTKITSTIKSRSTEYRPVTNVNFSISVGARVPRSGVTLYTLPTEVVAVYPAWRGYKFILVNDEIVVVDPNTFEIVAVIEA